MRAGGYARAAGPAVGLDEPLCILVYRSHGICGACLLTHPAVGTDIRVDFPHFIKGDLLQKPSPETEGADGVAERSENKKTCDKQDWNQDHSELSQFIGIEDLE